jgi:hypothetical protein
MDADGVNLFASIRVIRGQDLQGGVLPEKQNFAG